MKINDAVNPIQFKNQTKNTDKPQGRELRNACEEFEAIILDKLLSSMRESIPEGGLYEDSFAKDMFQSMSDQSLSRGLAHSKGAGLGEILFNQLMEK